jgi:hypothetical protein
MRDTLDSQAATLPKWSWLQKFIARQNWETNVRAIDPKAMVHPTVRERFELSDVVQCAAGREPYRPAALAQHDEFEKFYL